MTIRIQSSCISIAEPRYTCSSHSYIKDCCDNSSTTTIALSWKFRDISIKRWLPTVVFQVEVVTVTVIVTVTVPEEQLLLGAISELLSFSCDA